MKVLRVAFIGAGGVNFGGPEGPWDHASRLEQYCGHGAAIVTAIVEPDKTRANAALSARQANAKYAHMYNNTKIYSSVADMLAEPKEEHPDAVFIGLPPFCHGSTQAPYDVEIQLAKAGIHMFIEKPLSSHAEEQVKAVNDCINASKSKDGKKLIVGVGYMLRYSSAVKKMQEVLQQYGGNVISTVARYNCAYNSIQKASWWDMTFSGGPVVEQATHFCDLSRLFGGDIDPSSVQAVCVGANEKVGKLSAVPVDEKLIAPQNRIPRSTSAVWRYKNGAIGSLNHGLLMQGSRYTAEFEVWGDGIRLVLIDPYASCKLLVRTPESDEDRFISFEEEDMYLNEMKAFIDAIHMDDTQPLRSVYDDAIGSFSLSWAIREAANVNNTPKIPAK